MKRYDLPNECQANATSLTFGGEERHEYLLSQVLRHSRPIVRHRNDHTTVHVAICSYCNPPTAASFPQRLQGIKHEIEQCLIQKLRIHRYFETLRGNCQCQLDVALPQLAGQEALEACKSPAQRYQLDLRDHALRQSTVILDKTQQACTSLRQDVQSFTGIDQCGFVWIVGCETGSHVADQPPGRGSQ